METGCYVVHKTDRGWKTMYSIQYKTILEAQEVIDAYTGKLDLYVSLDIPREIGYGWSALDSKHILPKR